PAAPVDTDAPLRARAERSSRVNLVIVGLIVLACVALLPIWRPIDARVGAPVGLVGDAPPGVTAALRETAEPGDRILNPQPWGSWFEFALPQTLVALDSRIEGFPADVWTDYEVIRNGGPHWQEILARLDPKWIVATDD